MDLINSPHKRKNILTGDWVLVSPHRTKRPWQGKKDKSQEINRISFDPSCYLCPGNDRAGGVKNPNYDGVYVFKNDFVLNSVIVFILIFLAYFKAKIIFFEDPEVVKPITTSPSNPRASSCRVKISE